jgi:hypothetical protein
MPPQQAYGLLDLVDQVLGFRTHQRFPLPVFPGFESARTIGRGPRGVKNNGGETAAVFI